MALPSSGQQLTLLDVEQEFGDANGGSSGLTEYRRGGSNVPDTPVNSAISSSTAGLQLSQFYAASSVFFSSWNITGDLNFRAGGPSTTWGTFNRDVTVELTKANDTGSDIVFDFYGGFDGNTDSQLDVVVPNGTQIRTQTFPVIVTSETTPADSGVLNLRSPYGNSDNKLLNFYACKYRFTFSYPKQDSLGYLWTVSHDYNTRQLLGYLWTGRYKQDQRSKVTTTNNFWTATFEIDERTATPVTNDFWTGTFKQDQRTATTVTDNYWTGTFNYRSVTTTTSCAEYEQIPVYGCVQDGLTAPGFGCFSANDPDAQAYCSANPGVCSYCCYQEGIVGYTQGSCIRFETTTTYGSTQSATAYTNAGPYSTEQASIFGEGYGAFWTTGCRSSTPGSCEQDSSTQQVWNVGASITDTQSSTSYGPWVFQGTFTAFTDAGPYTSESAALNGEGYSAFNTTGCKSSTPGSCEQDTDTIRTYDVGATLTGTTTTIEYGPWVYGGVVTAFTNAGPYSTGSAALAGEGYGVYDTAGCRSSTKGSCEQDTDTARVWNVQVSITDTTTTVTYGDWIFQGTFDAFTNAGPYFTGSQALAGEGFGAFDTAGCRSSTPGLCETDIDTVRNYEVTPIQGANVYGPWQPQPTVSQSGIGPYETANPDAFVDFLTAAGLPTNPNSGCFDSIAGSCNLDNDVVQYYNFEATQGPEQFGQVTVVATTGDGGIGGSVEYITHVEGAPIGSIIEASPDYIGPITITQAVGFSGNDFRCPATGETQL